MICKAKQPNQICIYTKNIHRNRDGKYTEEQNINLICLLRNIPPCLSGVHQWLVLQFRSARKQLRESCTNHQKQLQNFFVATQWKQKHWKSYAKRYEELIRYKIYLLSYGSKMTWFSRILIKTAKLNHAGFKVFAVRLLFNKRLFIMRQL